MASLRAPSPDSGRSLQVREEKPYRPKRPHTKSRTGCKTCRSRRVKCDEAHPTCRRCEIRKVACVYTSPPLAAAPDPPGTGGLLDLLANEPLLPTTSDRDVVDMKLLWFFTTTASGTHFAATGARLARVDDILKVQIPKHAFECPFLMDCILGVVAMQLQLRGGVSVEAARNVRYRASAFEGYRKAITGIGTLDAGAPRVALAACSLLLAVLSSHMFREEGAAGRLYIVDWVVVWRGINLMINAVSPRVLWELGLAELFFRPEIDLNEAAFHVPESLLAMVGAIDRDDPEYTNDTTYYEALKYLGSLYAGLLTDEFGAMTDLRIITWFTLVPADFIELVRQRSPRALVILAYYSVFVKTVRDIWWVTGIGDRGIREISEHLADGNWSSYLALPRAALLLDSCLDVARLLLDDPKWEPPAAAPMKSRTRKSTSSEDRFRRRGSVSSCRDASRLETRGFQQDKIVLAGLSLARNDVQRGSIERSPQPLF